HEDDARARCDPALAPQLGRDPCAVVPDVHHAASFRRQELEILLAVERPAGRLEEVEGLRRRHRTAREWNEDRNRLRERAGRCIAETYGAPLTARAGRLARGGTCQEKDNRL